jgi:hypothetical protein
VVVNYDATCWESNTLTKIGEKYFQIKGWPAHSGNRFVRSSLDNTNICTNYTEGLGFRAEAIYSVREVTLPFTFPIRLPLKVVEE